LNYNKYDEIPTYRKQWFFWISLLLFFPIALVVVLTGDVYYKGSSDSIKGFGVVNRIVITFICVSVILNILGYPL